TDAAARSKSLALMNRVEKSRKDLAAVEKALEQIKPITDALKKDPDDAKANLEMGKYLCLTRGQWERGLPMLAKGSDEELKALAKKDLARPKSSKLQVGVGEGWWTRSEAEKDLAKLNLQGRAAYWYEKALPDLTGVTKVKLAKRVESYYAQVGRKVEVV